MDEVIKKLHKYAYLDTKQSSVAYRLIDCYNIREFYTDTFIEALKTELKAVLYRYEKQTRIIKNVVTYKTKTTEELEWIN